MPGPRLPMRKIRDVLRLSAAGMSKRKIAASLGVSATAARDCIGRAQRAGLTWPLPEGLTDEALELRLYPPPIENSKPRKFEAEKLISSHRSVCFHRPQAVGGTEDLLAVMVKQGR